MNITTSIAKLAEPIGFDIAQSSDTVQAELLNGLGRGFKTLQESDLNMQICYLSQHLTPEAKKLIKVLNDYANSES